MWRRLDRHSGDWRSRRLDSREAHEERHGPLHEYRLTGIIGAYIGAFLANAMGLQLGEVFSGWFWGNLLVAVVGAVILLTVLKLLRSSRS